MTGRLKSRLGALTMAAVALAATFALCVPSAGAAGAVQWMQGYSAPAPRASSTRSGC